MSKLPDWFDWKDYSALIDNEDWAFWEHEFCARDPNYEKEMESGLAVADFMSTDTVERKMLWENGILSYGMKGHETRNHIDALIKTYAYISNAKFIPDAEFKKLQKEDKLNRGHIYTTDHARTVGGELGYLWFKSQDEFDEFRIKSYALFGKTASLAFNIDMPEDVLVEQFKKIINQYKNIGYEKPIRKEINRKKNRKDITLTWTKGLAFWDLMENGCGQSTVAKELMPMIPKGNKGRKTIDGLPYDRYHDDYNEVGRLREVVDKIIHGGWKTLSGDPCNPFDCLSNNKK